MALASEIEEFSATIGSSRPSALADAAACIIGFEIMLAKTKASARVSSSAAAAVRPQRAALRSREASATASGTLTVTSQPETPERAMARSTASPSRLVVLRML